MTTIYAHRGNTNRSFPADENKIEYIENAIRYGFCVEIDLRWNIYDDKIYLGHDDPQEEATQEFLMKNGQYLVVHCKDARSIHYVQELNKKSFLNKLHYFYHDVDAFTMTSLGYIWIHPNTLDNMQFVTYNDWYLENYIAVMPEITRHAQSYEFLKKFAGVCTDKADLYKSKLSIYKPDEIQKAQDEINQGLIKL